LSSKSVKRINNKDTRHAMMFVELMHNQISISSNNTIAEQAKIKKTLEAFKNALKYI